MAVSQSKMEVEFGISLIIPAIPALPTLVGLTDIYIVAPLVFFIKSRSQGYFEKFKNGALKDI